MKYLARFYRSNPQLTNGGYETERVIEAKTIASARKEARRIESKVVYGGMTLLSVEKVVEK